MKIGIITAMEEELCLFKNDLDVIKVSAIAGRDFYEAKINGIDIVFVLARIGKVAAAATTTALILKYNVDYIIFTGVAGAIDRALNVGDIVISDNLIQHDMDASPIFPQYEIPLLGVQYIKTADDLVEKLSIAAQNFVDKKLHDEIDENKLKLFGITKPEVHIGTIVTGDQFIKDHHVSERIRRDIDNPKCVEMEGAAVAQVCYEFKVPCVVVRIISDKANYDASVDFMKFLEIASIFSRGIIREILLA